MGKTITDIYKEYKIFPNLQMHMLRVAAVASLICDNLTISVNKDDIVLACLLHDMGNIIKARMDILPEFFEPEGVEYWQKVKDGFVDRYGVDEHVANLKIAEELGLGRVSEIMNCFGFVHYDENLKTDDMRIKIAFYSDQRVAPLGVVSFLDRIADGKRRYAGRPYDLIELGEDKVVNSVLQIEKQIFAVCKIKPEDITDERVAPIIEKLRDFVIK